MRKLIFAAIALLALTFVACEEKGEERNLITVDFEEITLNDAGLAQNDGKNGSITSEDVNVTISFDPAYGTQYGFSVNNHTNVDTAGWKNPHSCIAGEGAEKSKNFATYAHNGFGAADSIEFTLPVDIESIMICNNTYAALSMKNGDNIAKKFVAGDFFKLKVNVYSKTNTKLGVETFFLADFTNGKSLIVSEWTKLDLSSYSGVSYLKFEFESSDNGDWGMNTPAYFCIDNISYYEAE